jgi:hypothetical protein
MTTAASARGKVVIRWARRGGHGLTITIRAPRGTSGTVALPVSGAEPVFIDGSLAWTGSRAAAGHASARDGYVYLSGISGSHVITTG